MKLESGNIWSGSRELAVFTNPTELAFRKGNLRNHYPVSFKGHIYKDAEAAYQAEKRTYDRYLYIEDLYRIMTEVLIEKFLQYPVLMETIDESGGESWIRKCDHFTSAGKENWEGEGIDSGFIYCLLKAYNAARTIRT